MIEQYFVTLPSANKALMRQVIFRARLPAGWAYASAPVTFSKILGYIACHVSCKDYFSFFSIFGVIATINIVCIMYLWMFVENKNLKPENLK